MNPMSALPNYEKPPVIEVAASVQFEPVSGLDVAHMGLLWQRYRAAFPRAEQKPPLQTVVERLGVRVPLNQVQFQLSDEVTTPRLWFVNNEGDELLQVQADRFIRNWRAVPKLGKPYPRYEQHIRPRFEDAYREFLEFVDRELVSKVEPNQCELTYINHITPCTHWSSHKDLAAVFRGWNANYSELLEQPVEAINLSLVHLLHDEKGDFLGRLHIALQSAFRTAPIAADSSEPIFVLTITARGKPTAQDESGVLGFFDLGRRAIVTAFDNITTPMMHKVWGKRYDSSLHG